ncbi:MAG: hypothetical protein HKN11_12540 [Rhizobiales bacterium]|nr:hypothetical protein [Hyphomicrobiales bacterium]
MSSGEFAVGEFCWQGPKGDSIILPSKGVQSRISLKTARRLESGAKPPATGNYLKRKVCKDPSFLQTEERRYHGPVKYLAIKENGPLAYCAREQKQWRLVNGDYIMAEGAKFCGKEMALRFCRQQFYWGLKSYKRAKGLGASFFDSQTICKRNCDGFAEIVCNKPQYMIVGKYSEDGPVKHEPLPIKTVSAIPNISGFEIRDSFDLIGGDLSNARGVRSVKACAGQCTKAARCAAFTYDKWNRWCFLKTSATQLRLEPKTVSGFLSRLAAPARLASNITLKHYRGKSFPYKGYKTLSSKSFEACGSVCLDEDRCVAFSFVKAGGDCKLLNSAGEYFSDSAVDSGVKRQVTK